MSELSPTLRELHRLRRHARDVQGELDRAPVQAKAQKARLDKLAAAFQTATDSLKAAKVSLRDRETTLKTTTAQTARYESQLDAATEMKQHDALQHQITHTKEQAGKLEDEVFALMERIDTETAALPGHEAAAKKGKTDFAAFEVSQKERLARLATELQTATAKLKETETALPADVVPLYKRLVTSYGADCLAAAAGNVCTNCQTQITAQQLADLQGGAFVSCKNCYRGLYLPE